MTLTLFALIGIGGFLVGFGLGMITAALGDTE